MLRNQSRVGAEPGARGRAKQGAGASSPWQGRPAYESTQAVARRLGWEFGRAGSQQCIN